MKNESLQGKITCIYGKSALQKFYDIAKSDPERLIPKALNIFTNFVIGDPAKLPRTEESNNCDCGHDLDEDHYDIPGGLAGVCRLCPCISAGVTYYSEAAASPPQ